MRLLPIGPYNFIIDLFNDLSSLDLIPVLRVAAPRSALHDAISLLSLVSTLGTNSIASTSPKPGRVLLTDTGFGVKIIWARITRSASYES